MTLMTLVLLGLAALTTGMLIGCVGVGGILLIPALAFLAGLEMPVAMATALFTFIFTGIIGTLEYHRRGSIDWNATLPLCLGGLLFGFLGAWLNARAPVALLTLALAAIILFAGGYTLRGRGQGAAPLATRRLPGTWTLILTGSAVGLGSGLTGVGGPVLAVPMLIILGVSPLVAIAASQVIQVAAGVSGTLANLGFGQIAWGTAFWVAAIEVVGVVAGARLAHTLNLDVLRRVVGVACVVIGLLLLLRQVL